jgi:hypothetical protein
MQWMQQLQAENEDLKRSLKEIIYIYTTISKFEDLIVCFASLEIGITQRY